MTNQSPEGKNNFEFYDYYCIILVYVYLEVLENKINIEYSYTW